MDLSDEEKFFVAHFVRGSYRYVKPVCGKYISLYSYLDQTDESEATQKKQIEEDDWYFSELLEKIFKQSNEAIWNSVFNELEREGFFENEKFFNKFLAVATWVYSKNSLRYFFEAEKQASVVYAEIRKIQKINDAKLEAKKQNPILNSFTDTLKSASEHNEERAAAMKLLYKSSNKSKQVNSNSNHAASWGFKRRSRLDGDGSDWREQS